MPNHLHLRQVLCGMTVALILGHTALADDDERIPLLPKYQEECAACHLAYPPGMLPAASWRRVMSKLTHHYGNDASLDQATVSELSAWLTANAGTYEGVGEEPPENRITRSSWFVDEHDDVPILTWKLPAVKSAANCTACHTQAEQGDFDERGTRIPRTTGQ